MIIRNLIKLNFKNGSMAMTDGGISVSYNGMDYVPNGYLAEDGISDVEETLEITTNDMDVTLNIADPNDPVLASFYADDYLNQRLSYYRQYIWDDGSEEFHKIFEGRMVEYEANDSENGYEIKVTASANIIYWQQKRGRTTNTDSQAQQYPGDMGFEFAGKETADIRWGR